MYFENMTKYRIFLWCCRKLCSISVLLCGTVPYEIMASPLLARKKLLSFQKLCSYNPQVLNFISDGILKNVLCKL